MSSRLTREELEVIWALQATGLDIAAATLGVVMVTREHMRPESTLTDIVRQYTSLEDREVSAKAVATLKAMGWLVESGLRNGEVLLHQADDLREKIASRIGNPTVTARLAELRSILEPYVRILGPMSERYVFESYLDLLRQAERRILLPMMTQTPRQPAVVPILQERAAHGVRVQILLAAPEVVIRLWGESMGSVAREAIVGWKDNARGYASFEVRICHSTAPMQLATCVGIDNRIARYDIYDASQQRTLEGVMIEVESPQGLNLNLVNLFHREFQDAWGRAEPPGLLGAVRWRLGRYWQWASAVLFLALTLASLEEPGISGIFGSIAATFLVNAAVSSREEILAWFRRFRAT